MKEIILKPIGTIFTPFETVDQMPIQPLVAKDSRGRIEILNEFAEGLKDIEGFSHLILIYQFHKIEKHKLTVTPFLDKQPHGVFATRAPKRPNKIGISTVKLLSKKGNILEIEEVDMLNETPLLDIKPFYAKFDNRENTKSGWLEKCTKEEIESTFSDKRFKHE